MLEGLGPKKNGQLKYGKPMVFCFFFPESWILSLRCCCVVLLFMVGGLEQTLLRDGFSIVEAKLLEYQSVPESPEIHGLDKTLVFPMFNSVLGLKII